MKLRQKLVTGALSAFATSAEPTSLEDRTPEQIKWEQTDPLSHVAFLAGQNREGLQKLFKIRWEYRAGPNRKTLIHGAQTHELREIKAELRDQVYSSQRTLAVEILRLWKDKKISCAYLEGEDPSSSEQINMLTGDAHGKYLDKKKAMEEIKAAGHGGEIGTAMRALPNLMTEIGKLPDFTYYHIYGRQIYDAANVLLPSLEKHLDVITDPRAREWVKIIRSWRKSMDDFLELRGAPHPLIKGAVFYLALVENVPIKVCPSTTEELNDEVHRVMQRLERAENAPTYFDDRIEQKEKEVAAAKARQSRDNPDKPLEWLDLMFKEYDLGKELGQLKRDRKALIDLRIETVMTEEHEVIYGMRERAALEFVHKGEESSEVPLAYLHFGKGHAPNWSRQIGHIPEDKRFNIVVLEPRDSKAEKRK